MRLFFMDVRGEKGKGRERDATKGVSGQEGVHGVDSGECPSGDGR